MTISRFISASAFGLVFVATASLPAQSADPMLGRCYTLQYGEGSATKVLTAVLPPTIRLIAPQAPTGGTPVTWGLIASGLDRSTKPADLGTWSVRIVEGAVDSLLMTVPQGRVGGGLRLRLEIKGDSLVGRATLESDLLPVSPTPSEALVVGWRHPECEQVEPRIVSVNGPVPRLEPNGCYAMTYTSRSDSSRVNNRPLPAWQAPPFLRFDSTAAFPAVPGQTVTWKKLAPTTTKDGRALNRILWHVDALGRVTVDWIPYRSGMAMALMMHGDTLKGTGRLLSDILPAEGQPQVVTVQVLAVRQPGMVCPTSLP